MININIDNNILGDVHIHQLNFTGEYDIRAMFFAFKQHHDIKSILEIGTNLGYTTKNIALNFPQAKVYTIDIYKELGIVQQDNPCLGEIPCQSEVGREAKNCKNVVQIYDNSGTYRYKMLSFDCVFIDGNHSYEGVRNDFLNLIGHFEKDAIISFHDVNDNPITEGVTRFLKELEQLGISVFKVNNSNVAYIIFNESNFILIDKIKKYYNTTKKIEQKEVITMFTPMIPKHDFDYLIDTAKKYSKDTLVELGCYEGSVSIELAKLNKTYAFDTFEGQPYAEDKVPKGCQKVPNGCYEELKKVKNLTVVKGNIKTTLDELKKERVSFIFFDMDTYKSTKEAIDFFKKNSDICVDKCLFIFHDYNWGDCPGINRVVDELIKTDERFKKVIEHSYFIGFEFNTGNSNEKPKEMKTEKKIHFEKKEETKVTTYEDKKEYEDELMGFTKDEDKL
jgi:precorrin-6B methylase 2